MLVAAGAVEHVDGSVVCVLPLVDVTTVAVGVHVAGEHEVDAQRVEGGHEGVAHIADAAREARALLVLAVGDDVLVHEHDLPRELALGTHAFQPGELLREQAGAEVAELQHLRVQPDEVNGPPVEIIVVTREALAAVGGQREAGEVARGQAHLPVQPIAFVIAHDGHEGTLHEGVAYRREEAAPMPVGFAVVREVAEVGEKIGIGMARHDTAQVAREDGVIGTLRVVDEHGMAGGVTGRGGERVPCAGLLLPADAVLAALSRLQARDGRVEGICHCAVEGEVLVACIHALRRGVCAQPVLEVRVLRQRMALPHDGAARGRVMGDDLTQELPAVLPSLGRGGQVAAEPQPGQCRAAEGEKTAAAAAWGRDWLTHFRTPCLH